MRLFMFSSITALSAGNDLGGCSLLQLLFSILTIDRSHVFTFAHLIYRRNWGRNWFCLFLESTSWLLASLVIQTNTRFVPAIWLWQHAWSLFCPIAHLIFQISLCLVKRHLGKTLTCYLGLFRFECVVIDVCIDILVAFWLIKWVGLITLVDLLAIIFLFCGGLAILSVKILQLRLVASYWAYNMEVSRVLVYVFWSDL